MSIAPGAAHAANPRNSCTSDRTLSLVRTFASQIPDLQRHNQRVNAVLPRITLMSGNDVIRCAAVLELSDGSRREATYSFDISADGPRLHIMLADQTTAL